MTSGRESERAAARLEALLGEQRAALREGRLDALGALAPRLERMLATTVPALSATQAAEARAMASENARLLRAALSGLAEARQLRRGAHGTRLATYDASGRLAQQGAAGRTLVRS